MAILGLPAGTDWHQNFTCTDAVGVPVNLTGASALTCVIFTNFKTVVFTLIVGAGLVVLDAANGKLQLNLTNAQTQSIAGNYLYEIYGTLANGDRKILDKGELHIGATFVGI